MKRLVLLITAALPAWAAAQQIGDVFGAVTYTQVSAKDTSSLHTGTYKPTTISLGLGTVWMENLAVDGYVFTGRTNAANTISGPPSTAFTLDVQEGYGVNLRPFMRLGPSWGAFAKLGRQYGRQEVTRVNVLGTVATTTSYAHTVYGGGVTYSITSQWALGAEYLKSRHITGETLSSSSLGASLRYRF